MNDAPGQERLPQINALVAEKVMGWRVCDHDGCARRQWWADSSGIHTEEVADFDPTTSWNATGLVVEKMDALGWGMVHWYAWPLSSAGRGHAVRFYQGVYPPAFKDGKWEEGDMGRSFPLSCCLAALSALGIDVPE